MAFQKCFVPALCQDIEAEVASVQLHSRVRGARHRHASFEEYFARELLSEVSLVLNRVVEAQLLQSVKALTAGKFVEIQGKGRFVVDGAETAGGPFKHQRNIRVEDVSFADRGLHLLAFGLRAKGPLILLEGLNSFFWDFD